MYAVQLPVHLLHLLQPLLRNEGLRPQSPRLILIRYVSMYHVSIAYDSIW